MFACQCVPASPDLTSWLARAEWRIKQAPVVFEGKVEKIELRGWPLKPQPGKTISNVSGETAAIVVRFSGTHLYRGEPKGDFLVSTGLGAGDCGYPFEPGESYLVYAWIEDSGSLSTSICSGTTPLEYADTALRLLRGDPPTPRDLADPRNEDTTASSDAKDGIKLCGKVSFPQGSKARPLKMVLWQADRDSSPLPHDTADTEGDGSFCFHELGSESYVLEALEDTDSGKYRYGSFYPGVKDRAQAKPLVVKADAGNMRADFSVSRIPLLRIKGYLRGAPEGDNDDIMVAITSDTEPLPGNKAVKLGPHGVFEIAGVAPGKYSIFAFRDEDTDGHGDSITFVSEVLDLDVQADIPGLKLQFVPKQ